MSIPFDTDDGAIVLPTARHPKLALAAKPPLMKGWLVMCDDGPYDGGLSFPEQPPVVYTDPAAALRASDNLNQGLDGNVLIEVVIP